MVEDAKKYQPLYLKYRPQSLDELVGQKSVVKTLSNALVNDRIAHAYLFTGPRGTGKTSSARILAKSINCDRGPTVSPCLECPSCESIKNSSSPSVFEIDAASNNSVDDARALIERAPLATQDGKHKLYIIDECHMLTKEAFNALLKTIEEPPPNVVFVLATTEEHKVPPTIVSRCQRLMFRLVNQEELAEHLTNVAKKEEIEIAEDALDLMSRRSGGGLRDALGLLDQAALLSRPGEPVQVADLLVLLGALDEDILLEISKGVFECDGHRVLEEVNKLLLQGREASLITVELAKHFLALTKASYMSGEEPISDGFVQFVTGSRAYVEKLVEQAKEFDRSELSQIVELMDRLEQNIKRSSQPSLTLEMGLLSICHRVDIASVKSLTEKIKKLENSLGNGEAYPRERASAGSSAESKSAPASRPGSYGQSRPRPEEAMEAPRQAPPQQAAPPREEPAVESRPESTIERQSRDEDTAQPASTSAMESEANQNPDSPGENPDEDRAGNIEPDQDSLNSDPEDDLGEPSGSNFATHEMDELWSDLLDALHKISIPAYSLVSMHANPLSLENNQLTLGVNKEFFQKSIESKAENLAKAYKALTGKEIIVKVKVVQEGELTPKKLEGRAPAPPRQREPEPRESTESPEPEARHEPPAQEARPEREPFREEETGPLPHRLSQEERSAAGFKTSNGDKESSGSDLDSASEPSTAATTEKANPGENGKAGEPKEESTLVKEAYRLFEGPGSRIIG